MDFDIAWPSQTNGQLSVVIGANGMEMQKVL